MAHDKTPSGRSRIAPRLIAGIALALTLAGCAPSPLYFSSNNKRPGTGGEIPHDGRGEPIWSAIHPVTPVPYASSPPVAPAPPAR